MIPALLVRLTVLINIINIGDCIGSDDRSVELYQLLMQNY